MGLHDLKPGRLIFLYGSVALGVLAGLLVLEFFRPLYFLWDDNVTQFLVYSQFNLKTVTEHGALPLINFHQSLGQTYFAQGQTGVLYLPAYLSAWLAQIFFQQPFWGIEIAAILHFTGGTVGMAAWLRRLKVTPTGCVVGAWIYATLPFSLIAAKSWIFIAYTVFYAPWMFYLIERMLEKPRLWQVCFYSLLKALFFLQGYVQYFLYLTVFETLYWAFLYSKKTTSHWKKGVGVWIAGNLLALPMLSPLFVAMQEAVQHSAVRSQPLPWEQLIGNHLNLGLFCFAQSWIFFPKAIFETPSHLFHWGGTLMLGYLFWLHSKKGIPMESTEKRIGWLLLIALLLSTPLNAILGWLPIFKVLRWPFKWFFFAGLFYVPFLMRFLEKESFGFSARTGRLLAIAALLSQIGVILMPRADQGFSSLLASSPPLAEWWTKEGRVLPLIENDSNLSNGALMGYNFPQQIGKWGFGGYDPMVHQWNQSLCLGSGLDGFGTLPLNESQLPYLSSWSVRYLTVPTSRVQPSGIEKIQGLRKIDQTTQVTVFENPAAAPFASFNQNPHQAVPIQFGANELQINPKGQSGSMTLTFVALPHYFIQLDHQKSEPIPARQGPIQFEIPPGVQQITLRYQPPGIEFLIPLSCGIAIGVLMTGILSFLRNSKTEKSP